MSAATPGYSIERLDPANREIVAETYTAAWAGDPAPPLDIRQRCEWLYLGNPAGHARVFGLRSPDGAMVGMLALAPRQFSIDGKPRTLGLLCDFIVHRAHRTGLPALLLQRAARRCADTEGWGTYAVPNDKSLRLIQRLGRQVQVQRPRLARPLRHYEYLQRRFSRPVAQAAWGLDTLTRAWDVGLSMSSRRHGTEWRDGFDVRAHDTLWRRVAPSVCMGVRDGSFLNWRFMEESNCRNLVLVVTRAHGSDLAAYAVGAVHDDTFEIRDFLIDPSAVSPRAAIGLVMRRARAIGAASVSVRASADRSVTGAFRLLGLRPREYESVLYGGLTPTECADLQLTRADEDV